MIIKNDCSRDDGSTYIFKSLNQLAEQNSHVQEDVNVLELWPSKRPWRDIGYGNFLPYKWPLEEGEDEYGKVLDTGARSLQIHEPEFTEFKAFCESRRCNRGAETPVDGLRARWPNFAKAFSEWCSCKEVSEILDNPDSAMILLLLSLPNLEKLVVHDHSGHFVAALNGIFRAAEKGNSSSILSSTLEDLQLAKATSQTEKTPVISDFLKNFTTLHIENEINFFPLQLMAPILSFIPLQELRMQMANDVWIDQEGRGYRLFGFQWITPDPFMTLSKLVLYKFKTSLNNLREFLSKAKNLETLWLGFWDWDFSSRDQSKLIKTISDTVGSSLKDLALKYWFLRDYRDKMDEAISKQQILDFRAFSKLSRLGLHARCWEDGEAEGHSLDFSVDDHGEYDFLPPSLVDLYLFKGILAEGSCKKFLEAVCQAKQKATSLENVFFMADKDQVPPDVSDLEQKLTAANVNISTAESDFPEEYLQFFRRQFEHGWSL